LSVSSVRQLRDTAIPESLYVAASCLFRRRAGGLFLSFGPLRFDTHMVNFWHDAAEVHVSSRVPERPATVFGRLSSSAQQLSPSFSI